ncbi:MAG: hypothetical protein PHW56_10455 [Methanosarcinaceae archaeon]|nr:hypothetical protein [Methanosarcinaceae archaeon]
MGLCVLSTVMIPVGALTVIPVTANYPPAGHSYYVSNVSDEQKMISTVFPEYKADIEVQVDSLILRGKALEVFNEVYHEKMLKEGALSSVPPEAFPVVNVEYDEDESIYSPFEIKGIFEIIITDYNEDIEWQADSIILKDRAFESFEKLCCEIVTDYNCRENFYCQFVVIDAPFFPDNWAEAKNNNA